MITTPEEYLKFLYEIQNNNTPIVDILAPSDETIYKVDLNTRKIDAPEFLSVLKDHNAETIHFTVDRYFDNMDLTNTICLIQYINKNAVTAEGVKSMGYVYAVPVYDVVTFKDENKILFPWTICGPATAAAGPVEFAIMFYKLDDEGKYFEYRLNTTPSTSKVLYGMDVVNPNNENLMIADVTVLDLYQRIEQVKQQSTLTWIIIED